MLVRMEVDHVGGSGPEEEDWEDVDEVRRGSMCCNCWMMGTSQDIVECKSRARTKAKTEAGNTPMEKGTRRDVRERKVQAHYEDRREDFRENGKVGAAGPDTGRQNVDGSLRR